MISQFTKKYIKNKAHEKNISLPDNYLDELYAYCSLIKEFNRRLSFRKGRNLPENRLGCNAGYLKCSTIVATPEWAFRLTAINTENVRLAFLMSLGHELSHKENDLNPFFYIIFKNGVKFISYVNEIHADFGATQKFANYQRITQVNAMLYKVEAKKEYKIPDRAKNGHPSWRQRIEYVKNYDFDKKLIRKIAKDTNCNNEKLIQKVIEHFEPIHLK